MENSIIFIGNIYFCSYLLLGPTPGEAIPRLDPSRPWLKPQNNWGQGWGPLALGTTNKKVPDFAEFSKKIKNFKKLPLSSASKLSSINGLPTKLTGESFKRKLDPTRPWLQPGNNWGQGKWPFGTSTSKLNSTWPWFKPGTGNKWDGGSLKKPACWPNCPEKKGSSALSSLKIGNKAGIISDLLKKNRTKPLINPGLMDLSKLPAITKSKYDGTTTNSKMGNWMKFGTSGSTRKLDPTRPWLRPGNNWGQGIIGDKLNSSGKWPWAFGTSTSKLERVRPWFRPGNNWGQGLIGKKPACWPNCPEKKGSSALSSLKIGSKSGTISGLSKDGTKASWNSALKNLGTSSTRKLDPTRPWLRPGNNWGQGIIGDKLGIGSSGKWPFGSSTRKLDPTRPWLRPGNNWGQGIIGGKPACWPNCPKKKGSSALSSLKIGGKPGWKPVTVDPDELPAFKEDDGVLIPRLGFSRPTGPCGRRPCKYKLLG